MAAGSLLQIYPFSAKPSPPPVGSFLFYMKTDDTLYLQDSSGVEYAFGSTAFISELVGDVTGMGPGVTTTTVAFVGGESAADVASAARAFLAATSSDTPNTIVTRDGSGNFSANIITASLNGNAATATSAGSATTAVSFTGPLLGDVTGTQDATVVSYVDSYTAAQVGISVAMTQAATALNTASTLVKRDASGNFSANVISASLVGNVTGNVTGNLTGNVTGNVSGSSSTFTGPLLGDVTGTQGATFIDPTVVSSKVLTGLATGANVPIAATDSILVAFEKVQAQISAIENSDVTAVTASSPLTSSGGATPNISFINQSANAFLAGPLTGMPAAPTFRVINTSDLPSLSAIYVPQSEVGVANGVASLDSNALVPLSEMQPSLIAPFYTEYHVNPGYTGATSTGSYNQPYTTIQAAVNAAQSYGSANSAVILHGTGTTENVVINNYSFNLLICYVNSTAVDNQLFLLNGNITISGLSTRIRLKDFKIQYPGGSQPDLIDSSSGRNYFSNVGFEGGGGIQYTGSWARWHEYTDCTISGTMNIAGSPSSGSQISLWRTRGGANYVLNSSNVTLALYDNFSVGNVTQTAGSLIIDGGRGFTAGSTISSTTNNGSDLLEILNVSLQTSGSSFAQINKTGTCPYILSNVFRNEVGDILTGTRLVQGASAADEKYVPTTPANWPSPPTSVLQALDDLAASISGISGSAITSLTGDGTATGPGGAVFTLATVNSNVGTFGSSTSIPVFTVNAKGLITAASGVDVVAPAGTLTGSTLASNVLSSSLTSVGTLTNLNVAGNVGIGTTSPRYSIDLQDLSTATSGTVYGMKSLLTAQPTSASAAQFKGVGGSAITPNAGTQNVYLLQGVSGMANHNAMGIVTYATGVDCEVYCAQSGTIQNAFGSYHQVAISNGGTIQNGYGSYIAAPYNTGGGGTWDNYYGLYVGNPSNVASGVNYAIYSQGGTNYFGGLIQAVGGLTGTVNYTPSTPSNWLTVPTSVSQALDDIAATHSLAPFIGDAGTGGTQGLVPAPGAGTKAAGDFLSAAGTWSYVDQSKPIYAPFTLVGATQWIGAVNAKFENLTTYTGIDGHKQYAAVVAGGGTGTLFIWDITNPTIPVLCSFVTLAGAYNISVAQISGAIYAFVPSSGGSSLYIVNITNPYSLSTTSSILISGSPGSLYDAVYANGYVYIATQNKGLTVVDVGGGLAGGTLSTPIQSYQEGGTTNKSAGVAVVGNFVYTTNYQTTFPATVRYLKTWELAAGGGTLAVPFLANTYTIPGGPTPTSTKPSGIAVSSSGNTAFVTDGGQSVIDIIDVTSPTSPNYLTYITPSYTLVTNTLEEVVVSPLINGNYIYVPSGANATNGGCIDLFDITIPSAPVKVKSVYTGVPNAVFGGLALNNGYIFCADYGVSGGYSALDVFTQAFLSPTFGLPVTSNIQVEQLSPNTALISNGSQQLASSITTATELSYVHGVTSSIQAQINAIMGSGITSLNGDVVATGPGAATATIQPNVVTNSKLAEMAANTIKGNNTGVLANAIDLSETQVAAMLSSFFDASGSASTVQTNLSNYIDPTSLQFGWSYQNPHYYTQLTYTGSNVTGITYWDSPSMITQIFTKGITYTGGLVTQVVLTRISDSATLTKTITYSGSEVSTVTRS
jgi:hypothetical protein